MIRRFEISPDGRILAVSHTSRESSKICKQYPERIRRWFLPGSEELRSLLRVLAAYIAEGSATIKGITTSGGTYFSIAQNDPEWLEALRVDLFRVVDCLGAVSVKPTGGRTHALRTASSSVTLLFAALSGIGSRGKFLPSFIYDLTRDDFMVFWMKLIEGDGYVHKMVLRERKNSGKHKGHDSSIRVGYTSNSQTLIAGLSYALDQHGISPDLLRESKEVGTITRGRR
jgi:hypothetical protein